MREAPGSLAETELPDPELLLLITPEPRFRVFLQNLRDLFRKPELDSLPLQSAPAPFWSDVFVDRELPWRRFLQSGSLSRSRAGRDLGRIAPARLATYSDTRPAFTHPDVVYYTPSEYLPPLDTRHSNSVRARKADPEYSAQPIISLPREARNRSQTVVTPPNLQLDHDVALPNVVSLFEKMPGDRRTPIGPAPAVPASEIQRLAPRMERSVIAPPPDLQAASQKTLHAAQPAVIAPPPT